MTERDSQIFPPDSLADDWTVRSAWMTTAEQL